MMKSEAGMERIPKRMGRKEEETLFVDGLFQGFGQKRKEKKRMQLVKVNQ